MAAPFHLIDTATGEVVQEYGRGWATEATRPRRHQSKRVRAQVMENFILAAGLVLGVCLYYVVMP